MGPKPSIIRAADDELNHFARKWTYAVHVGNDAPRILSLEAPPHYLRLSYLPYAPHVVSELRDALSWQCLDAA